jgi:hypothetical protein
MGNEDKPEVINNSKLLNLDADNNVEQQFLEINQEFEGDNRISVISN